MCLTRADATSMSLIHRKISDGLSANHTAQVGIASLKPVNGLTPTRPELRAQLP